MTIYCIFTVGSAYERILKSVNIWWSYRQESWLSHITIRVFFRLQFSVDKACIGCIAVWVLRGSLFTQFLLITISWTHFTREGSNKFKAWWDLS